MSRDHHYLYYTINGNILKKTPPYSQVERVIADSKNYVMAAFDNDERWFKSGEEVTAIFTDDKNTYYVLVDPVSRECVVPWEVLHKGKYSMSLMRGDLITTNKIYVTVEESGYKPATNSPKEPTPDIYTQIIGEVSRILAKTDQIESDLDKGKYQSRKVLKVPIYTTKSINNIQDGIYDVVDPFSLSLDSEQSIMLNVAKGALLSIKKYRDMFEGCLINNLVMNDSSTIFGNYYFKKVFNYDEKRYEVITREVSTAIYEFYDLMEHFSELFENVRRNIIEKNITVSQWSADNEFPDYPYKADISLQGVTSDDVVNITWKPCAAFSSGKIINYAKPRSDSIRVYSKDNTVEAVIDSVVVISSEGLF